MHSAVSLRTKTQTRNLTYVTQDILRLKYMPWDLKIIAWSQAEKRMSIGALEAFDDPFIVYMYLFTTLPHPHGHWQLQGLLGNEKKSKGTIERAFEFLWIIPIIAGVF